MEGKIEDVLKQYPIQFTGKKRIRGAILLETEMGFYTLVQYRDSLKRLSFQQQVKEVLEQKGYRYTDLGIVNIHGELLARDNMGNRWLLKRWFVGRECNLYDRGDIAQATKHLARLHNLLELPEITGGGEQKDEQGWENAEMEAASCAEPVAVYPAEAGAENSLSDILERHSREMKRVYNYIRSKRKKNEMEICILNQFQKYYEQAQEAEGCLEGIGIEELEGRCLEQRKVCHGSYNYHNILFGEKELVTTNFENAAVGIQIMDLYDFLRKIMEKNSWNTRQGMQILDTYRQGRDLEGSEARLLYVLLLFPEKFWKQMNFYYNGKKSWMSVKNYNKLLHIEAQEDERRNFLREAKRVLF